MGTLKRERFVCCRKVGMRIWKWERWKKPEIDMGFLDKDRNAVSTW